jgi:HEPN domain-containing protein
VLHGLTPEEIEIVEGKVWARAGVDDFYFVFFLEESGGFSAYSTFFCHQGLEKICKAYLLGCRASEYETKEVTQAKKIIDEIARNKCGHDITEMIVSLVKNNVLNDHFLKKKYAEYDGKQVTGKDMIKILEKAYIEARYPVRNPVHENYPLLNKARLKIGYHSPIGSSEPRRFAFGIGLEVLKRIERDFNVTVPRENFKSSIPDNDWVRFRRIFFGETHL